MWIFYPYQDSIGCDITCVGNKNAEDLLKIAKSIKNCVCFNTLGYLKYDISEIKKVSIFDKTGGCYVNNSRLSKLKLYKEIKYLPSFQDYIFYPSKDSPGFEIEKSHHLNIFELKKKADQLKNCKAFNTLGSLKSDILPETEFTNIITYHSTQGLYVKKQFFRVKLLCNWDNSEALCKRFNKMFYGDIRLNNIELTWEDKDIDFYAIFNKPRNNDFYIPGRTIVFHVEPWCCNENQNWGIKTWGEWASPDENKFLQVRSHKNYYNNASWQLSLNYFQLKTMNFEKTKLLSTICSSKYFDPGHIKRIDFLKYLEKQNDDVVKIDIYGYDNIHKFKNYVNKLNNKNDGIVPYKYYFMAENNQEVNYITEKFWEPILVESLCFYWGCQNVSDYIDSRAYIELDLNDFEKSFNIMKEAILNDEWSKRIEIIRQEKQKILEYYSFLPTLHRIINKDFQFNYKPDDGEILLGKHRSFFADKVIFLTIELNKRQIINSRNDKLIINCDEKTWCLFIYAIAKFQKSAVILFKTYEYELITKISDLFMFYDSYQHNAFSARYISSLNKPENDLKNWLLSGNPRNYENIDLSILSIFNNKLRIKCINLERRSDRKEQMIKKLENLINYTDFFKAIDGKQLIPDNNLKHLFRNNDFGWRKGVIGCALSQYYLWKELLEDENYDKYLILEDDVELNKNLTFQINCLINLDFDILYLGYTHFESKKHIYNEKIFNGIKIEPLDQSLWIGGAFGYILTKEGARKFINYIEENGIAHGIDYVMVKKIDNLKQYSIFPFLITSDYADYNNNVDSDIQRSCETFNFNINNLFWWRLSNNPNCNNAGDDITPYIYEKITGKKPQLDTNPMNSSKVNVLGCGSILDWAGPKSIIWGSGSMFDKTKNNQVLEYRAVRGPLTREVILKKGNNCPPVYGDPGLLLPLFFYPKIKPIYKIGIIAHYQDNQEIEKLAKKIEDTVFINMINSIENVITQILNCEVIISSSLHGIIIPHAYNKPAAWLDRIILDKDYKINNVYKFKYHDYYASREIYPYPEPIKAQILNSITKDDLISLIINYPQPQNPYDTNILMNVCPFTK